MGRNKKIIWRVIVLACVCIVVILIFAFWMNPYFKEISISDFEKIVTNGEKAIVYYGQDCCGECQAVRPIVEDLARDSKIKVKYLDADKLSDSSLLKRYAIEMTPTLVIINNGEVKAYEELSKESIERIISNPYGSYLDRPEGLVEISYELVTEKLNSDADFILYIGRTDCRDCQKFHPIVEEFVDSESGSGLYYMNIKDFRDKSKAENAKEEDVQFYKNLMDKFEITWVPCVCHIVNGKIESKYEFLSKDYYEIEDENEKEKVVEDYVSQFILWMKEFNS